MIKFITPQIVKTLFRHSKKAFAIFTLTLFLFPSFPILSQNAKAQEFVCPEHAIDQITNDEERDSSRPSINADGTRIAFDSEADGNFEIYLFDMTTGITTQITNEMGLGKDSANPSINADGTRIAFRSNANLTGDNPNGNFEIFLFDTLTGFTQITFTPGAGQNKNFRPSINADGTRIAFDSNADGNFEIYLFDITTGITTQITNEMGVGVLSLSASISADGTRIPFQSNADINGTNLDGNFEIYLYDMTTGEITQITFTTGAGLNNFRPSINADGTRMAFESRANINGTNPDGNVEIYLFDTITGLFTQLTFTAGVGENSSDPSINADGTRIAFDSRADINGGNPDGNDEIYLFDTTTELFTQITNEIGLGKDSTKPSINANGTRIAFQSLANINGGNPDDTEEIYLARCFDPNAASTVPTLSQWGLIAMAGILGIVGFMVIRRRKAST